ncbi:MAG: TolC family protein [Flavobacteriales bacterium]|nr:TolC family protein [Flavobacteriales bacterium]
MKTYILIFFTLFTLVLSKSTNAQSLENCLQIAAENNPELKAKYSDFEASLQKVAQVSGLPDPVVSFGYFISPVETRVGPQRAKIGITQMFPWFGTLKTAGNVLLLQSEARYSEFLNSKNELYMQVKSAWYPIYEVNQKILMQKKNLEILKSYKSLATSKFRNDRGSMVDVIRVEIMLDNTETEIKLLEDQLKPLTVHFNKLLNRPDTVLVQVEQELSLAPLSLDYRKDSLLLNNPQLQALDLKLQSAMEAEELNKKQALPKFGLGLDYVFVGKRTDMAVPDNGKNVIMPMLSMSIPVYRAKYKASTNESRINQVSISTYRIHMENVLISTYESAKFDLEKATKQFELYNRQILKIDQVIRLLESAYSNSGKDFEEILKLNQEILSVQIGKATATKSFYLALAKLDYLTSKTE